MKKNLFSLILFLGAIATSLSYFPVWAQNDPLESYRWQHRLLLVFAPKVNDPRLTEFKQAISTVQCEFNDRDLLLGVFANDTLSRIGKRDLTSYDVAALRSSYGIKSNDFAVILIGKDGMRKSHLSEVPEMKKIFEQIDAMPMRQEEISNSTNSCLSNP